MSNKLIDVPVTFITTREKGAHGKFRYPEHHLLTVDGQKAIHDELIPQDAEVRSGEIIIPERGLAVMQKYADKLATGAIQKGLYTGQTAPEYNCATFVHEMLGVDFDPRLVGQPEGIGEWSETAMDPSWAPQAGEAVAYRYHSGAWTHWVLGVGDKLGVDKPGQVIGVKGANGHTLSIASSADYAKGFGHTTPHLAVPVHQ